MLEAGNRESVGVGRPGSAIRSPAGRPDRPTPHKEQRFDMDKKTFRGGAHPPERKDRTSELPIEYVRSGANRWWFRSTSTSAPPIQPLVKVGDTVKRGQKIADAEGRMTVPVHAPISGRS
ncbi:MAG: hypothetical protein MZV70_35105 [Desulfobacterales bacterium]|nr:hypothetical protein [Desulfobacterales bacterium]